MTVSFKSAKKKERVRHKHASQPPVLQPPHLSSNPISPAKIGARCLFSSIILFLYPFFSFRLLVPVQAVLFQWHMESGPVCLWGLSSLASTPMWIWDLIKLQTKRWSKEGFFNQTWDHTGIKWSEIRNTFLSNTDQWQGLRAAHSPESHFWEVCEEVVPEAWQPTW